MNKYRRKMLDDAIELLGRAKDIIEQVKDEESDAFDNMPESLQSSERGERMGENVYGLEENFDNISDAIDSLLAIMEG